MTQTIYRVGGYYATGTYHTHLVGATSPKDAMNQVLAADNRIVRVVKAQRLTAAQVEALK
jgi:hypothetical protein